MFRNDTWIFLLTIQPVVVPINRQHVFVLFNLKLDPCFIDGRIQASNTRHHCRPIGRLKASQHETSSTVWAANCANYPALYVSSMVTLCFNDATAIIPVRRNRVKTIGVPHKKTCTICSAGHRVVYVSHLDNILSKVNIVAFSIMFSLVPWHSLFSCHGMTLALHAMLLNIVFK